jgi:protein ImuA
MPTPVKLKAANEAGVARIFPKNHGVLAIGGAIRLSRGRVHEVLGDASDIFAVAVAAQAGGAILWIGQRNQVGSLAPTGLQEFLDPKRVIITLCVSRQETLWAAEQSLRLLKNGCVIVELNDGPDLKESRRLQIAAEDGDSLGVVLIAGRAQTSAAETRWLCEPLPEENALWTWRLIKNKSGEINAWRVGWRRGAGDGEDDAKGIVLMAAAAAA